MFAVTVPTCSFAFTLNDSVTLAYAVEAQFFRRYYSFPSFMFVFFL